jgi:hypothetical protein
MVSGNVKPLALVAQRFREIKRKYSRWGSRKMIPTRYREAADLDPWSG